MEIGNDDLDLIDDFELEGSEPQDQENNEGDLDTLDGSGSQQDSDEGFISELLRSRGIQDMSKIKFEDEEGEIKEYDWNTLSNSEKLGIIQSSEGTPDTDLDESETELINTIRTSGMTPSEYIEYIKQDGINNYVQNRQAQEYQYQVDQFSDDDLFIYDFMSRMGDVSEDEAREALERAKSNESLYAKQIGAIRKEYKSMEEESIRQAQLEQEEQAQEQYNQFTDQIVDQIGDFNDFSGYDLNLDDDDRQELYDFITGFDKAGNNYFTKALSDPKVLVRTAWLTLNGEQMMEDITNYFQNEIKSVRKQSYEKGLADAKKQMNVSDVVFMDKQKQNTTKVYDDLDDF